MFFKLRYCFTREVKIIILSYYVNKYSQGGWELYFLSQENLVTNFLGGTEVRLLILDAYLANSRVEGSGPAVVLGVNRVGWTVEIRTSS